MNDNFGAIKCEHVRVSFEGQGVGSRHDFCWLWVDCHAVVVVLFQFFFLLKALSKANILSLTKMSGFRSRVLTSSCPKFERLFCNGYPFSFLFVFFFVFFL